MDYAALAQHLGLPNTLPYTLNWSAAPDFLGLIAKHCLTAKPATIVECSSGTSTLVLARCCQLNGHGHVYSLENGAEYAAATSAQLEQFGLDNHATVIHAPLSEYTLGDQPVSWYSMDHLDTPAIDMLVIDGPPAITDCHARYPALPLLHDRLAANSVVYLDDAARPGERDIVNRWCEVFPELLLKAVESERGCVVLTKP